MRRQRFLSCSMALSFALLCGCHPAANPNANLVIGGVISVTGTLALPENLQAVNLALREINAHGGVLGKQLVFNNQDDHSDGPTAATVAQALVGQGVPVIIGGAGSTPTEQIERTVTNPAKVVFISGVATAVPLTDSTDNSNQYFFRTVPSDALQGKLLAEQAKAQGMSRVVALYDQVGPYGDGLSAQFVQSFQALGGTASRLPFDEGQPAYGTMLQSAYTSNPDGLLLVGYAPEAVQIIKDYLQAPPSAQVTWMFSDGLADPALYSGVGSSSFTFPYFGTVPAVPAGARLVAFQQAFKAQYGSPPTPNYYDEYWYDAVYLTALAIEAAGNATPSGIKAQIPAVINGPGTVYGATDYQAAVADLHAGKGIEFQGVTGLQGMGVDGDLSTGAYNVWKFDASGQPASVQSGLRP